MQVLQKKTHVYCVAFKIEQFPVQALATTLNSFHPLATYTFFRFRKTIEIKQRERRYRSSNSRK